MAVQQKNDTEVHYGDPEASNGLSVFSHEFDHAFYYAGDDLGITYRKENTLFRLWAPTSWEAQVILYSSWDGDPQRALTMKRGQHGTWELSVQEDLEGWFYTYRVRIGDEWNEAADPYAKATSINGDKGAIIDLRKTDPEEWTERKPPFQSPTDAVIYELHIRDLSVHPKSGISNKGKFLGLCEPGTRGPEGILTGLDHIADLGVTHIQLLPISDYCKQSVDEAHPNPSKYNWGYDPKNYNVPEGSYSTNPYDPAVRIRELKHMIQTLHNNGLRVIMDVVYNHIYDGYRANLPKLVPGYYLRYKDNMTLSNGSVCGNDLATERTMVRKFIVDSIVYWTKEYHIDGFRFDLMGLIDVETMKEIRRELDEIDPSILMIGEGWEMETALPFQDCANQKQASQLPRIAHFNGFLRDAIKGDNFKPEIQGFIQGSKGMEQEIRNGVAGSIDYSDEISSFTVEPVQTVNYAECHDNYTLWDKIQLTAPDESEEVKRSMHRLASSIILTSQGIPFLHAGQEFMRTKYGVENSFNASESINRLDWDRCATMQTEVDQLKRLIALRKAHPAFRLKSAEDIRRHLYFEKVPERCVGFTLRNHADGDSAKHLYIFYNANQKEITASLPDLGDWEVLFGCEEVKDLRGNKLTVGGIGMVVLAVTV